MWRSEVVCGSFAKFNSDEMEDILTLKARSSRAVLAARSACASFYRPVSRVGRRKRELLDKRCV